MAKRRRSRHQKNSNILILFILIGVIFFCLIYKLTNLITVTEHLQQQLEDSQSQKELLIEANRSLQEEIEVLLKHINE